MSPLLPLACTFWLVSLCLVAPNARARESSGKPRAIPEHALSLFSHSENCQACHNSLESPSGEDVSIGTMWEGTMMANSARDPYWQAGVRREVIDHASRSDEIQDECAACHMPMARRISAAAGLTGEVFAHLPIDGRRTAPLDRFAADGVSCTVCHQITADKLGTPESFNANFVLPPTPPGGSRVIFGPHQVDAGRKTIMRSVTGFVQAEADHLQRSELCASCHTLITTAYGANGEVIGSLPEQMNYQEWQHSDFPAEGRTCQSCHMPAVEGPVRIASVLGDFRDRLARHVFVGGNAYMVRMLDRYRDELGVTADPVDLQATANATVRLLQEETAAVSVTTPRYVDGRLEFTVGVQNRTGHKFPTGYPSRRAWLHVTVRNNRGEALFESGAVGAAGAIGGNDTDADGASFEPHYDTITRADQVQIYESILGDPAGRPTTGLLTATRYLKDNRLLPRGFDKATAAADIAVYGDASGDDTFTAAGDSVRYAVNVGASDAYSVAVELCFQSIGYRWAHNLEKYDAAETNRFLSYYNATAAASTVVVAKAEARFTTSNGAHRAP